MRSKSAPSPPTSTPFADGELREGRGDARLVTRTTVRWPHDRIVPTMGYLHEGHLSLLDEAKRRADKVVASVYVNPTQFAPDEDFDVYPRDLEGDLNKLSSRGCDAVFTPETLYSGDRGAQTWVEPSPAAQGLCGASRPGFFRGVTTVVSKLFNIVEPDLAVFGKKTTNSGELSQRWSMTWTCP